MPMRKACARRWRCWRPSRASPRQPSRRSARKAMTGWRSLWSTEVHQLPDAPPPPELPPPPEKLLSLLDDDQLDPLEPLLMVKPPIVVAPLVFRVDDAFWYHCDFLSPSLA